MRNLFSCLFPARFECEIPRVSPVNSLHRHLSLLLLARTQLRGGRGELAAVSRRVIAICGPLQKAVLSSNW